MNITSGFFTFVVIFLLKCVLVTAQFDYNPPIIDETQKPVDSTEIKCLGSYDVYHMPVNRKNFKFFAFWCFFSKMSHQIVNYPCRKLQL